MSQMTHGFLLGIRKPEQGDVEAFLRTCAEAFSEAIKAHDDAVRAWVLAKPDQRTHTQCVSGRDRYVPTLTEYGDLVGFWIAVGTKSGMGGVPRLHDWLRGDYDGAVEFVRSGLRTMFPRSYRNARVRYRRFREWAGWLEQHDEPAEWFTLTVPRVWLVPVEVA